MQRTGQAFKLPMDRMLGYAFNDAGDFAADMESIKDMMIDMAMEILNPEQ
jgi:hypothetical protein